MLRLKVQVRRPDRMSLFLGEEYWRAATFDTISVLGIQGGEMTDEQVAVLSESLDVRDAFDVAARALSFRSRTTKQLEERLRSRGFSPEAIAGAIARLGQIGAIDDDETARARAEVLRDRRKGPVVARREMTMLGIDRERGEEIVAEVFPQEGRLPLAIACRGTIAGSITRPERQRLAARLTRSGHEHDVVAAALAEIPAAEDEASDSDEARQERPRWSQQEIADQLGRRYPTALKDRKALNRAVSWFARRGVAIGAVLEVVRALEEGTLELRK